MSIQLSKEHHYHYFLENLFFRKCHIGAPLCGWGVQHYPIWHKFYVKPEYTQEINWFDEEHDLIIFSTLHHHPGNPPPPCVMPRHNCKNAANFRKPISIYIKENPLGQLKNIVTTVPNYALFLNSQEKAIHLKFS